MFMLKTLTQVPIKIVAGGYLLYRLKSIVGINLSSHYHAIDLVWHPVEVLRDIVAGWSA